MIDAGNRTTRSYLKPPPGKESMLLAMQRQSYSVGECMTAIHENQAMCSPIVTVPHMGDGRV